LISIIFEDCLEEKGCSLTKGYSSSKLRSSKGSYFEKKPEFYTCSTPYES